jgi:hypothetical protein
MTPLCELMHLPLVFNPTWRPAYETHVFVDEALRHSNQRRDRRAYHAAVEAHWARIRENPEVQYPMGAIDRPFTLGWALRTIFMDLGFYGAPAERIAVKEEILDSLDNLELNEAKRVEVDFDVDRSND